MLQLGIAGENIGLGSACDRVLEFPQLFFDALEMLGCTQSLLENGRAFVEIGNLIKCADLKSRLARQRARVRVVNCADQLKQRCFSGAVCSNKTDFFRWVDLEGDVSKYVL